MLSRGPNLENNPISVFSFDHFANSRYKGPKLSGKLNPYFIPVHFQLVGRAVKRKLNEGALLQLTPLLHSSVQVGVVVVQVKARGTAAKG